MKKEFIENIHYYLEDGRVVFTALYHLNSKECCGDKCRHCPYDPLWTKGTTDINRIESED